MTFVWRSALAAWLGIATIALGVSSAQPVPSPAAKVIDLTGQVSVLRDSQPWALSVGDPVLPRQIIITGPDGAAKFQVSDGSTFEVYPNSRVTFRDNPGNWRDLLDVWMGRVKVYIQKFGGQPNPNRVQTPTAVISVRGTVFDVAVEDDLDTTLVLVEEGQVAVNHRLQPTSKERLLGAGEYLRVYKNLPLARQGIDKSQAANRVMRALADLFETIIYRTPRGGGSPIPGGGTGGPTVPGDTDPGAPPAPPPSTPGDPGATPPPPPNQ